MILQFKVTYYDEDVGDMVTSLFYGREKALEFAKGKKFVSIILNY